MIRIHLPAQPETLRASPSDAADPGSALRLQGEMWGQKMLVVFFFFFSLIEISGLATRLVLLPRLGGEVIGVQCFL